MRGCTPLRMHITCLDAEHGTEWWLATSGPGICHADAPGWMVGMHQDGLVFCLGCHVTSSVVRVKHKVTAQPSVRCAGQARSYPPVTTKFALLQLWAALAHALASIEHESIRQHGTCRAHWQMQRLWCQSCTCPPLAYKSQRSRRRLLLLHVYALGERTWKHPPPCEQPAFLFTSPGAFAA